MSLKSQLVPLAPRGLSRMQAAAYVGVRMRDGLGEMRLKYLVEDTDRDGNVRLYVRKRGSGKVRLHQQPGSREFLEEYWTAVKGETPAKTDRPVLVAPAKGTLLAVHAVLRVSGFQGTD